nr:MAG: hypothetical protein [Bacteriophage sp.]
MYTDSTTLVYIPIYLKLEKFLNLLGADSRVQREALGNEPSELALLQSAI